MMVVMLVVMMVVVVTVVVGTTRDMCSRRFGDLDVVDGEACWSWWIPVYRFVVLKSHTIALFPIT